MADEEVKKVEEETTKETKWGAAPERQEYADLAFDIVKHASDNGSRLPGSEGERKFANYMGEKLEEIGIKPIKEEFAVSPRASIGGIPFVGVIGLIVCALVYFAGAIPGIWIGLSIVTIFAWVWIVSTIFFYKKWFDMFFPQKISQNVYGELLPADGKYDYTIFLSGHLDTSWNWKHSEHTYKYRNNPIKGLIATYLKVGAGVIGFFVLTAVSFVFMVYVSGLYSGAEFAFRMMEGMEQFQLALYFIVPFIAILEAFLIMWADKNPENASRGAMDNATGIALSYAVTKYFHDNPDKMPKNCRIIDLNVGSEEAGLRGSMAFGEEHKGEDILKNAWNINIDSVADKDYFEVVIKDDWQFCRFDTDLEKMFKDTFAELGIESKSGGCIHNPVGGSDSTPMTKAGIKSVTFAAQNPMLTYYYHTFRDTVDRFDKDTVGMGLEVVLSVIDKIEKFQAENGYRGPQTK